MKKVQDFLVKAGQLIWQRKKLRLTLLSLLSLLALFVLWGSVYYSKSSLVGRYLAARSAEGPTFENIKEYLVWDDSNELLTNDEATYTEFAAIESKAEQKKAGQELLMAKASDQVYVKRVGRRWGIFPDYRIAMKPLTLTVQTNLPGLDIMVNDKKLTTSDSDAYSFTLDHLPEADYRFSLSGQYEGKTIDFSKAYDGKNTTIDLSVIFKTFTVTSNLTDGDLYFGQNRIASLSEGSYEVEGFPVNDSVKVYVSKKFSDGNLETKKIDLATISDGSTVELNRAGLLTDEEGNQILQSAFNHFRTYINSGQDATDLSSQFENGANNDFYKALKSSISDKLTASRKPTSLTLSNPSLTELRQTGVESYALSYSLSYNYYYDESTDQDKKTSGYIIQSYMGQIKLVKTDNGYRISQSGHHGPELLAEDNQVKSPNPIPEELVGTWKVSDKDKTVTITLAADGSISKKTDYKDDKQKDTTKTAKVSQAEEVSPGLYRYHYESGDKAAFTVLDDIGANGSYVYGVQLNGSELQTVYWPSGDSSASPQMGKILTKD